MMIIIIELSRVNCKSNYYSKKILYRLMVDQVDAVSGKEIH